MGAFQYGENFIIQNYTRLFTADEVKTLASVPIVAIPAAGLRTFIMALYGLVYYKFGTVAFTTGSIQILTVGAANPQTVSSLTVATTSTATIIPNNSLGDDLVIENTDVVITADADSVTGDGTVLVSFVYAVITDWYNV